jgi:hypothetical protein
VFKNHNRPLQNDIEEDAKILKRFKGLDTGSEKNTLLSSYLFKENVKKTQI